MLFHTFHSQEERRKFGGSYFIEVQYCKLAQDSEITKIVSADVIEPWKKDSLYIHGDEEKKFWSHLKLEALPKLVQFLRFSKMTALYNEV